MQLIYTNDAKEYLTNEQLEREIKDVLNECGGRININEIPQHINVNYDIIERCMDPMVRKSQGKITLING